MSKEIVKSDAGKGGGQDFVNYINSLPDDAPVRGNCKLCNTKNRKEAEALFERTGSIQAVYNFLREKSEDISYGAVRKHLANHYQQHQSDMSMKELVDRMGKWSNIDMQDEALLRRWAMWLDMEGAALAAENPNLPIQERRKNIELMNKISQQIITIRQYLRERHADMLPVEIVFKNLYRIIEIKIQDVKNPEVKKVLKDVIDQLEKDVAELPAEGYKLEG